MSQDIVDPVRDFAASGAIEGIDALYLFGSQATGRTHRESDVDLGALLCWESYPTRSMRSHARVRLISELIHVLRRNDIDVVILNDAPPLLARHIVTHGKRVFCARPAADHAFVRDILLRAADLAPFIRRTRAIKLEHLRR